MGKLLAFVMVVAVFAIAGLALNLYYRPTVERANRSGTEPAAPLTGWRRAIALIVLTPVAVVALPFAAIIESRRRRHG